MSLAPLIQSGTVITLHALAALPALVLGAVQFLLPKGGALHRIFGYVWAALMMAVAASSLAIHDIRMFGPFSPIHLLSLLVLVSVPMAVRAARRGQRRRHRAGMIELFLLALVGAGAFTLLPGRVMHEVVFGP